MAELFTRHVGYVTEYRRSVYIFLAGMSTSSMFYRIYYAMRQTREGSRRLCSQHDILNFRTCTLNSSLEHYLYF